MFGMTFHDYAGCLAFGILYRDIQCLYLDLDLMVSSF